MEKEKLLEWVRAQVPAALTEENKQFPVVIVPAESYHDLCMKLKSDPETAFDYLFCQSGVDTGKQLMVVCHLSSTKQDHSIVVKVKTDDRTNPAFDSLCDIWRAAEFYEREVYDLFGIRFNNHPDLRRIFLEEDWKGYPFRKDYVDEVNIVEL
jgi:NADH-quinone oxidoreductase subunit C